MRQSLRQAFNKPEDNRASWKDNLHSQMIPTSRDISRLCNLRGLKKN